MEKLACVVLNYNDAESVEKLYSHIQNYSVLDLIIIVDGASTDGSYARLKALQGGKTFVICADKNGGYGYGNNIGIRYARSMNATHVLIANPDVMFTEEVIQKTLGVFRVFENCVAAAPRMRDRQPAYKFSSPMKDAMFSSMFLNKLMKPRYYQQQYFNNKEYATVDVLPGSLVMFDINKLWASGLYDEKVFLYHEEMIMGRKFQQLGYESVLLNNAFYDHYHQVSVNKSIKAGIERKRIIVKSHEYYLRNYCPNGKQGVRMLRIMKPLILAESYLWSRIKQ